MNETTDQMSLLDAFGMTASEETQKPKKKSLSSKKKARPKNAKASKKKREDIAEETAEPQQVGSEQAPAQSLHDTGKSYGPLNTSAEAVQVADDLVGGEPITLDKYICFALYSANHAMHGVYKSLLKEIGLTYPQFLAMTVLWETNNVPVGAITAKLQLDTNTLTPLLKRLEAMGLVTRTRNVKDERQVILKLTRKGRALEKKTEHFGSCIFASTGLNLEEITDLQSRIMRLRDNLRDKDAGT
ncbi:MarR family transcriptional regulator [uncultured Roseibium sp.]|uniref:MarR family winged helix-turn-helix transcriptional regulator n=1 Tax=uncultured Roseibium sp. TaxID=1936171 RepID=UPI00343AE7E9